MLTRKAKYAIKALLALAREKGEPLRASSIAKREGIPRKFLEVILFEMVRSGVLQSRKGPGGGYFLAKHPSQVTVGPLLRAIDGPLAPVPCVSETEYKKCDDCADERTCAVRLLMQRVRDVTAEVLDGATLADLNAPGSEAESGSAAAKPRPSGPLGQEAKVAESLGKTQQMMVHKTSPFNGGPPPELLVQHMITPQSLWFVRNHGTIPRIEGDDFRLQVDGLVEKKLRLSLADLRGEFPEVTVQAALMCAGNRRQEFDDIRPIRGEVPWGSEAVGNATWTGARLSDVLASAGLARGARYVEFEGLDEVTREGRTFGFGGSIPVSKARNEEVLLAYGMNGQTLAPAHGFPLRAVVPGFIGARSVKWLKRIRIQREPSGNYFQAQGYKLFPPHIRAETADWKHGQMLGELFTTAAVCAPGQRALAWAPGEMNLRGYALGGDGRKIARVEVSVEDGESWHEAQLERGGSAWAWCFWECRVKVPPRTGRIWVRAWDDQEVQPPFAADLWNFKGYMNNSWYCLRNTGL